MFKRCVGRALVMRALAGVAGLWGGALSAGVISGSDIVPVPPGTVGSGNGTLDFILLTESSGGSTNSSGAFDGDNANTHMPTGNGNTSANESFITSIGELRAFYRLNFPDGQGGSTVNQLVIMVDVNETGGPQSIDLNLLQIIRNFDAFSPASDARNDPFANDITSAQQNGTNATFSGGTMLANTIATHVLGQVAIGAGHADHAIFTGIDVFSATYADSDRLLIHWESSDHDNGGETIFLSGTIGANDIPEPAAGALALIVAGTVHRRCRRRSRAEAGAINA